MAKATSHWVCQNCGSAFSKWAGQCTACGEWNTLVEEAIASAAPKGLGSSTSRAGSARGRLDFVDLAGTSDAPPRRATGMAEFDRVTGGGLVEGAAVLIGGDPGIGKSTLLLQAVCRLADRYDAVYVSGEESVDQVRLRASRLGLAAAKVKLASATSVRDVVAAIDRADSPDVIVIDSIQTMWLDTLDSAPGTVAQVRASAQELIRAAKRRGTSLLLVGHVTKEGVIAGPRVLEHMVDAVIYFEGERGHPFRILRGVKNRFGPTDEIGVFDMTDRGLVEVPNPSELFLAERRGDVSGTAVFAGVEGTRPLLVEIQALVAPTTYGTPRRAVVGWDSGRLSMVLAVLEARGGLQFGGHDVYLNVAGGLRVSEPAADLAVAAALASALAQEPVPADAVLFGEIGLVGEVRQVGQTELRLKEAAKLGFGRAILPSGRSRRGGAGADLLARTEIGHVRDLLDLFGDAQPNRSRGRG
ncbi:MAG: repair protein RadA [Rhodospirillales bacterium]|nr:repair protein RadA [Rhodospirillales bacterium]